LPTFRIIQVEDTHFFLNDYDDNRTTTKCCWGIACWQCYPFCEL